MACDSPFFVQPKFGGPKVPVPCGRCPPCKKRRVDSWVFRLLQEDKVSSSAHFVTLTYDTRFVPISPNGFMTLRKKDFQNYMKRLRKLAGANILKYYAVGEYGSQNQRPHYHAIIFNVPRETMFFDAWHLDGQPLGGIKVGTVTGDSIAYCMKYIDKASFSKRHSRDDREPEFPLMSKRLGESYVTDATVSYHKADVSRLYVTNPGGYRVAMPRYYRNRIYSKSALRLQIDLIQKAMDEQEAKLRAEFSSLGYPPEYTFEMWKGNKSYARYKNFYLNQKSRSL